MTTENSNRRSRILVVDDSPAIHGDYRKILTPSDLNSALDQEEQDIFGDSSALPEWQERFDVSYAFQGQEALAHVETALSHHDPYAVAFVDGRMPPGWDGVETITQLWKSDPDLQVVVCTAYSDYSWGEILKRLGRNDNFVILKKPFDPVEVLQLAHALSRKWHLNRRARLQINELNRLVDEQTSELKRANQELQSAIQELAEVSRMKSEFVANMSHELRTPLNGILGMAEFLLATPLVPDQRDSIETIKESGSTLLRIVEDLLDFSKIDSGKLSIERTEFSPRTVVERVLQFFQQQAQARHLALSGTVEPNVPANLFGDAPHFAQVLLHLTSNAIKFTEQGHVKLHLSVREKSAEVTTLCLTVEDTGIGISPQKIEKLFNPFVQADGSSTRRFGGAGLGLAICRRLADLMGGNLTARSTLGQGSTFSLILPFYASTSQSTPRAA